MVICVTGHRPNKLYGYDLSDPRWQMLKLTFKTILQENHCTEAISGMALGVDTIFALAVLELKEEGFDIKLHCAIPCKNHSCKWPQKSIELYNKILQKADIVKLVSEQEYRPYLMQVRNRYMVDHSDKVVAVWDGSKSGTANCVEYAEKSQKEIVYVRPDTRTIVASPPASATKANSVSVKAIRDDSLSIRGEARYVIVDAATGEVLDDAQGYGYKSAQRAYAGFGYLTKDKTTDLEKRECGKTSSAVDERT